MPIVNLIRVLLHTMDIKSLIQLMAVTGSVIAMLLGLLLVFKRMAAKKQGFGPNSLKAIGVVLFVPSLVILAIATDFKTETLSALLGTVAGYVLSISQPKSGRKQTQNEEKI